MINVDDIPRPQPVKSNYSIFIIFIMAITFLFSSISYTNLSKININLITDPVVQDEVNNSKSNSLWIMILSGITFFVYGYMLVKNIN